jgi:hypothetical protein
LFDTKERITVQRERILEKLQIQSTDQLTENTDRFASRGNRQDGPSTGG